MSQIKFTWPVAAALVSVLAVVVARSIAEDADAPPAAANNAPADEAKPVGESSDVFDVAAVNRRAYERIAKALAKPAEFSFKETPLTEVIERLETELGVPVRIDYKALIDAGMDPKGISVTYRKAPISARSALDLMLSEHDLTWIVQHEMLTLTTTDKALSVLDTRIYDFPERDEFGELIYTDFESIIELITSNVAPPHWDAVGGSGNIKEFQTADTNVLVISQTREVHEQIESLLAQLRAARRPVERGKSADKEKQTSETQDAAETSGEKPVVPDARPASKTEPASGNDGAFDIFAANRRAYERVAKALARPAEFSFKDTPLTEVVERLEIELGVPITIDQKALTDAGMDPKAITIALRKSPQSMRSALDTMLSQHGLDWIVHHELLWITSRDGARSTLETRIYDFSERDAFGELVHSDFEPLIEMIMSLVKPTDWDSVGGAGKLREFHTDDTNVLIITQSREVHEGIESLLAQLRAARHPVERDSNAPPTQSNQRRKSRGEKHSSAPAIDVDPKVAAVAVGANQLGFDLYRHFIRENDKNCFFSPYSISTALAMVRLGATGETGKELATALHFAGSDDDLHAGYGNLRETMRGDEKKRGYELRIANRMWARPNLTLEKPFVDTLLAGYGGELGVGDFAADAEGVRKTINAWVADQTADRIADLMPLGTIHKETRAVIANAVYFNGKWRHKFREDNTEPMRFDAPEGRRNVDMMMQVEDLPYTELDDVQVVSLPYGSEKTDGRAAMLVLLPRSRDAKAFEALEYSLSAEWLQTAIGRLKEREVKLFLPKFTFNDTFALNANLAKLGVRRAFDPENAEFDAITTTERLWLEYVVHKAFIEVDEAGTEAAAATGGAAGGAFGGGPPPSRTTIFRADHPFVFLIYDANTGSVLFLGRMMSPPEAESGRGPRDRSGERGF